MHPAIRTKNDLTAARFWAVAITLMALALGGSTELVAQFVVATVTGVILLLSPPRHSLGIVPNLLFLAFFGIALSAYFPAGWFSTPLWRQILETNLQLPLSATRTPQPWLTAQACALLLVGLAWAYYLLGQQWNRGQRLQAVYLLVLGVAVLALITVAAYVFGLHIPGWKNDQNRGWFPNRNQSADVLALAGILNYTLVVDRLRRQDRSGWFWLATLLPVGAALVVSYSRSGIIIFFTGITLWHLWPNGRRHSLKWTALSMTLILTLLTLFLLFGGDTLARFQNHPVATGTPPAVSETPYRLSIQGDALRFSLQDPWLGVGLGNFEALFATVRENSVNQNRAIHPESDWLWTACEMGWPAVLIILAGIAWWLRLCLPFEPDKRGESLRRALVIAVLMFLVHSFVDVSAHRLGSLWFALILASLATPTTELIDPAEPFLMGARRPLSLVFRGVSLLVMAVAVWWFSSLNATIGLATTQERTDLIAPGEVDDPNDPITEEERRLHSGPFGVTVHSNWLPPTTADLDRLRIRIDNFASDKQVASVAQLATAALQIAPLDWTLYFKRAWAEVYLKGRLSQAGADFRTARVLEPHWAMHCFDEGTIWLSVDQPDLCMDAWNEALRRDPVAAPGLFSDMLGRAVANDLVRADLADLAITNTKYLVTFLEDATPPEVQRAINRLLAADPDLKALDAAQRQGLFANWWIKGDKAGFGAQMLSHPDWQSEGWPWLAQFYASQKDFPHAWQTVAAHATAPALPANNTGLAIAELERSFYSNPDNTAAGLILLQAEIKAGNLDDGIAAARALEKNSDHPASVFFYEAQLWAAKQQWALAWTAWANYDALKS